MSMDLMKMSPALQQRVTRELQPGEVVRWAVQPDPSRLMLQGFLLWLFFIPWTAFSLFWIAGASGFHLPDFSSPTALFPLFGLPFLLIGLGGLLAPWWLRLAARHTVYVITNQRAFSLAGWRTVVMLSWLPQQLAQVTRSERADGSGDLVFDIEMRRGNRGSDVQHKRGFMALRDVRTAETFLNALRTSAPV